MTKINLAFAITLAPEDAIKYFASKGYAVSWNWQDTWQEAHNKAFTVAKVTNAEILQTIRDEVQGALDNGTTEQDFKKVLAPRLQRLGWWGEKFIVDSAGNAEKITEGSPWRLKVIYRTNLSTAFQAGRYKQQQDNKASRPHLMYVAVDDNRSRLSHKAMHGQVFPIDDPIWQTHYPPNGWGCRCRVRALSDNKLNRLNKRVQSSAGKTREVVKDAGLDKSTGEMRRATVTEIAINGRKMAPSVGWNHNVANSSALDDFTDKALNRISDPSLKQATQSLLNGNKP
jgi:SPP1 gp7 family putative phage head morphogenesis protein